MDQNVLSGNLLNRCLHQIYEQILTGDHEAGLRSVERLIYLVRYISRPAGSMTTVEKELQAISEVFHIHQIQLGVDENQQGPEQIVPVGSLLYEICQHGIELIHGGCQLSSLRVVTEETQITYTFTGNGKIYGGTINGGSGQRPAE